MPSFVSTLLAKEPVYVAALVTWVLAQVGAFLIGHTHLLDAHTWSGLTTVLVPVLSALVLGAVSTLTRRVVSPVAKPAAPAAPATPAVAK